MLHSDSAWAALAVVVAAALAPGCSRAELAAGAPVGCEECVTLTHALVFDGSACVPATVVLRGNHIAQVASDDVFVAAGTELRFDGSTVLPGLFDLHTHVTSPSGPEPGLAGDELVAAGFRAALRAGVLTVLDLGASKHVIFEYRRRIRDATLLAPELLAAGPLLTPSGGHPCYAGSLPGDTCDLVDDAEHGMAAVSELESDGADVVKVVIESGHEGFVLPEIRPEVLGAIAEQARAARLLVVAHLSHAADIELALDSGVRVFAHVPTYDEMTPQQAKRLADAGAVVIPTLAVRDGYVRLSTGTMSELADPGLADDVPAREIAALQDPAKLGKVGDPANRPRYQAELDHMRVNLRRCLEAGVTIAAGTDAGNLGVFHGLSLRRELELWVQEGMAPSRALRAATLVPAELLGLHARGRIEPGADADLLVVGGNPCERIEALQDVQAVFRRGAPLDRDALSLRRSTSLSLSAIEGLPQEHACLRAGECAGGLACDAGLRCSATCESATSCAWGAVCMSTGFPEVASTCQAGEECSLVGQDCPNETACVWMGRGAVRCWYPGDGVDGEPCASWGGCAPGSQCDEGGTCRLLCVPGAQEPGCAAGKTCVDDSDRAGVAIGHCQ